MQRIGSLEGAGGPKVRAAGHVTAPGSETMRA
jgi:hypothetical protein